MASISTFFIAVLPIVTSHSLFSITIHQCRRYSFSNRPSQDCSDLNLTKAPRLFSDVIVLNLSNNTLNHVESFPNSYGSLISLRMDYCQIEKLDIQALSQLRNLKNLDVSHNLIKHLVFSTNNKGLITLNLSHNRLRYLPDLSSLTSLRLIDLSFNRLTVIQPRFLPPNIESLRLTGNQVTHLKQWPFLLKLQELDVAFNPLSCECSLWKFVVWAEGLALFDSSTLPCRKPVSLRKNSLGELLCGPEIENWQKTEEVVLSLGDDHQMCCIVTADPAPQLHWQHNSINITNGISFRHLSESGRAKFCLDVPKLTTTDLGKYSCIASLEDSKVSKDFIIERDKIPLVLNSAEHLLFYCQFSICVFLAVFCCVSCCCIRRKKPRKTQPHKEFVYNAPSIDEKCFPDQDYVDGSSISATSSEWLRIQIWKHRMQSLRAPLAEFDQDTHIMPLIHTSV